MSPTLLGKPGSLKKRFAEQSAIFLQERWNNFLGHHKFLSTNTPPTVYVMEGPTLDLGVVGGMAPGRVPLGNHAKVYRRATC